MNYRDEDISVRHQIIAVVETPEAENFARFILWRESLSHAERARLKDVSVAAKGGVYAKQAMASLAPTEKQLALLRNKRCAVVPQTRLEASELIDGILNGKGKAA